MRYKLNAESRKEAYEELIRKIKCGKIPEGKFRLVNFMSLNDYRDHWYAERLD